MVVLDLVTESAQGLIDLTRWLGLGIAVLGAILANPEATAHAWGKFHERVNRVRGFLARFLPFLRRHGKVLATNAQGWATGAFNVTSSARGIVGWGPDASVEHKLDLLDQRTLALHREVGQLQADLTQMEARLKGQLAEAVESLRGEASEMRAAVDAFRKETVRTDASALPLIVLGVVISGIAPDAARVQVWFWVLVLLLATFWACRRASEIVHEWRRKVAEAHQPG